MNRGALLIQTNYRSPAVAAIPDRRSFMQIASRSFARSVTPLTGLKIANPPLTLFDSAEKTGSIDNDKLRHFQHLVEN